jgi:hypothetical protein
LGGFLASKHRRLVEFHKIKKPAIAGFFIQIDQLVFVL